MYNALDFR